MSEQASRRSPIRPEVMIAFVLAVLAFVVFSPALFGPFLWDDAYLIVNNPALHSLSAWPKWFSGEFLDATSEQLGVTQSIRYYRPLISAIYATEYHFVGAKPFLFHFDNLLLHSVTTVLAFFALRRWSGSTPAAALAAALFAFHPTKAENVAWISGRTDIVCAVFILAACAGAALRLRGVRYGLALEIFATMCAYLSKEIAVILPAFMAIEVWVARGRPALNVTEFKRIGMAVLPQLVVAIVYLFVRARWLPIRPTDVELPFSERFFFVGETVGRYVALTLLPYPLSAQHALLTYLDGQPVHAMAYVGLGVIAIVGLFVFAFFVHRRVPMMAWGIALYVGALLPVSNVMPMRMSTLVAERFLYLPSLGIALVVAGLVEFVKPRVEVKKLASGAGLVLVVLAGMLLDRAVDFSDARRFWNRELALHPESIDALRYAIADALGENDFAEAERLTIEARNVSAKYYLKGLDLDFTLQFVKLRARRIADIDQDSLKAVDQFYQTMLEPDAKTAALQLSDVNLSVPLTGRRSPRVRALRPDVLLSQAEIRSRLGRDAEALAALNAANEACATCDRATAQHVMIIARAGEYGRAREMVETMARTDPENAAMLRKTLDAAESAHKSASVAAGPMALQLKALEYSTLGVWGRAYQVLAPYRKEIEEAPSMVMGFAELAFRAGDESVARAILEKHVAPEQVESILTRWKRRGGRR